MENDRGLVKKCYKEFNTVINKLMQSQYTILKKIKLFLNFSIPEVGIVFINSVAISSVFTESKSTSLIGVGLRVWPVCKSHTKITIHMQITC